ncbi:uncharacterized protein LOC133837463 [Drosophila sulfurigaster albostrigata]|uniref:Uncharacterized protein LOC117575753 n=1 Tax=Drosophila albomicans TaxID=7291 RepID=A0A6P8XRW4_DROAB|nr:uncharacterized protein LOC117575753 [Drosophila albomicans]XP_062124223.1 uncharacterized protein LOC133837463 [Drosophila sulfurigaster albostrigata]
MKRKTSEIWYFFRAVDDTFALCNICKAKLSYKTTTTNLSKHMNRMHPNANVSVASPQTAKYKIEHQVDRHRGKPRNPAQEILLLNFIKKHPGLLKNPSWENRNAFEALWDQLVSELNENGPPQKDVATWKKALKDWKRFIIKKVEKNEMHNIPLATGLSSAEETIASLCRLNDDDVNQIIINQSDDDLQDTSNATFDMDDVEDVVPEEEDHSALQDASGFAYEADDCKEDLDIDPLFLQSGKRSSTGKERGIEKEFETISKTISSVNDTTSSTQLALKEFCALYKQKLSEDRRHHLAVEQLMAEKIELKKKLLEIEQRKLLMK